MNEILSITKQFSTTITFNSEAGEVMRITPDGKLVIAENSCHADVAMAIVRAYESEILRRSDAALLARLELAEARLSVMQQDLNDARSNWEDGAEELRKMDAKMLAAVEVMRGTCMIIASENSIVAAMQLMRQIDVQAIIKDAK